MNFKQAMVHIHSLNRFGSKPGLERIGALLHLLDNPQNNLKFIHVAGTNGKGSTCTMLSSIFTAAGLKTGLFISPFVVDFRERIQLCGEFISKEDLCRLTQVVKSAADKLSNSGDDATEFEFITALAFCYFAEKDCDIVVLETGLGGSLDSTNIIVKTAVSVITKIGLDHTEILGDSIEKITFQKCGIIKSNSVVVSAPNQPVKALSIIKQTASEKNCEFHLPDIDEIKNRNTTPFLNSFQYKELNIKLPLVGLHQLENAITAIETAKICGISNEFIQKGLSKVSFPARLEIISKKPLVILDGAHNPDGAAVLAEYIKQLKSPPVVIVGMMADKDMDKTVSLFAPLCSLVITVSVADNARSATAQQLAQIAKNYCKTVYSAENYHAALELADKNSDNLPIVICGSLYLAADIRDLAINRYKEHSFDN